MKDSQKESSKRHSNDAWVSGTFGESDWKLAMLAAQLAQGEDPEKYLERAYQLLFSATSFFVDKQMEELEEHPAGKVDIDGALKALEWGGQYYFRRKFLEWFPGQGHRDYFEEWWRNRHERVFSRKLIREMKREKDLRNSRRAEWAAAGRERTCAKCEWRGTVAEMKEREGDEGSACAHFLCPECGTWLLQVRRTRGFERWKERREAKKTAEK